MSEVWLARPHQIKIAAEALPILKSYGIVYLAMEERTGKSITAMTICEACAIKRVAIITTKKAAGIEDNTGWTEALAKFPHKIDYQLINYHSAQKLKGKFDLVILDEPHKYISGYPKRSGIWEKVYKITKGLPIIYSSATPYAQGTQLLFNQFALSSYSPWFDFKNYYEWFANYADRDEAGQFRMNKISPTQLVIDYTKVKTDKVLESVKHLFISYTRKQLGFKHEPKDVLHYIELSPAIKEIYNEIATKKVLHFTHGETGRDYSLICDVSAKLRYALHMLEGGVLKIDDEYIHLGNTEKVDYLYETWGDNDNVAIMYYFKGDAIKLTRKFKKARLLQATTYAEGVDLSMYKHLIIYSQNHSTSQHTQRRARQANMDRAEEIDVHYLLVKGAASDKAYKAVSVNKINFVDTVFERI